MKLFTKIKSRMRRSSISRRPHSNVGNRPRARHYDLRLSRKKKLIVTVRRFRTKPENRAKSFRQLVVPLYVLPIATQEIVIRFKRTRRQDIGQLRRVAVEKLAPTFMVVAGVSGIVYFGAQLVPIQQPENATNFTLPTPETEEEDGDEGQSIDLDYSEPTSLRIESIEVDTEVMTVGKNADQTMEVPPIEEYIAGWYRLGPTPGEIGPSIIVGHVDNREGPSVFWRLDELATGDEVVVTREDGEVVSFEVYEVQSFDQNDFPTATVYGDTDGPELRLITCGGDFNWRIGRYTHNTVVFARILDE